MYIGRRDPEIQIIIPQNLCYLYQAHDGRTFIEVFVPPENIFEYSSMWGSIMVQPAQVDILHRGSRYNSIRVNDGARIVCSIKNAERHVLSSEILLPEDIIGRFLKYYRYLQFLNEFSENGRIEDLNIQSFNMYIDMIHLGQTMETYMNRLPKKL